MYALSGVIINNLLIGARLVTIFFGFFTLVGIYLVTRQIADKKTSIIASLFYIISPYSLFFDRLALMDSAVCGIAIWSLYFTIQIINKKNLINFICLGLIMGLGLWIKTSSVFYVFLPITTLSFHAYFLWRKDNSSKYPNRILRYLGFSLCIVFLMIIPLISNEYYPIHWSLLSQYTYSLLSVFSLNIVLWFSNFTNITSWLFFYITPVLFIFGLLSIVVFIKNIKYFPVIVWIIFPLFYEIFYAKLLTSRHVLVLAIPIYVLAGCCISKLLQRSSKIGYLMLIMIFLWGALYDLVLVTNPIHYQDLYILNSKNDLSGYFTGFSSGYAVDDAIKYLRKQMLIQPITVVMHNDHGNPEDAVVAYLNYSKNIEILLITDKSEITGLMNKSVRPLYFVSRGGYSMGLEKNLKSGMIFKKPKDSEYIGVYLLKPEVN